MGATTGIQWTDSTWNPIRGCSRVSPGCENCYAETTAARFSGPDQAYDGLVTTVNGHPRWTGKILEVENRLLDPLRWAKPRRVFVNSMSDLFHPTVSDEWIAAVFAVMAATPRHTYQILTKRPDRMRSWLNRPDADEMVGWAANNLEGNAETLKERQQLADAGLLIHQQGYRHPSWLDAAGVPDAHDRQPAWPLKNVWLGVSVEDQRRANERIPYLVDTPAVVRFLSVEPLLERLTLSGFLWAVGASTAGPFLDWRGRRVGGHLGGRAGGQTVTAVPTRYIDWVIVGGESGHAARPCEVAWVRDIVDECVEAAVPVFVKQLGSRWAASVGAMSSKGGLMNEWPDQVRRREWPEGVR